MTTLIYPANLPGPSTAATSPAERRRLSDVSGGPQQFAGKQRDYLATQQCEWTILSSAEAAAFNSFWDATLSQGASWFSSTWPAPPGWASAVRRFIKAPQWTAIPGGFWKVVATFEVRGRGVPPVYPLVLGMHFDGDYTDKSGHTVFHTSNTFGTAAPTFLTVGQKFGSGAIRIPDTPEIVYSDSRGTLSLGAEYQISVWVKLATSNVYGVAGGAIIDLGSWATPNGFVIGSNALPPAPPASGQFLCDIQAGAPGSVATLRFDYPFIDVDGKVRSNSLRPVAGAPTTTHDGLWHHIGIAADATSVRAYIDGVLVQTDGDPTVPRAPGQRLPYTQSTWINQRFLLFGHMAGSSSGDYSTYPSGGAFALQFHGDVDDLLVTASPGAATFTGATITVPTAPFLP